MMDSIMEAGLVTLLFTGYVVLWKVKQRAMLKNAQINPEVIINDPRPTQRFFSYVSKILTIGMVLLIVLHGYGLDGIYGFNSPKLLSSPFFNYIGFILGGLGLVLCFIAQKQMGNNWRVGIDLNHKTELVDTGLYKFIRNPTYAGLFTVVFGV